METKFKGSEGKWGCVFTSDKKRAVRNKGGLICILTHPSKYSGQDERYDSELEQMRADQRLIANAPELLKALINANNVLKMASLIDKSNTCNEVQLLCEKVIKETIT